MTEGQEKEMSELVSHSVSIRAIARFVAGNDEMLTFLAARGIRRADLEQLAESADHVIQGFYNQPEPV